MQNALSYQEYVERFNDQHTDFRSTSTGPIAKADGRWYSVNGRRGDIMDVRHALSPEELTKHGVSNDRVTEVCPTH